MESTNEKERRRSDYDFLDFSSFWGKTDEPKKGGGSNTVMADRLMEKLISMMIPTSIEDDRQNSVLKGRILMQSTRPPLSFPIMSNNSSLMALRTSTTFRAIDGTINFVNWNTPWFTIGVLLIGTHIVLNPILLTVLPPMILLYGVMVPHYLAMYPPDTSFLNKHFEYNPLPAPKKLEGYRTPKPVPEWSREFILNFTDLQNHMTFYISAYDFTVWLTNGYLYFKDEQLSSVVYLLFLATILHNLVVLPRVLPLFWRYFPIKLTLVAAMWMALVCLHPKIRERLLDWACSEDTRLDFADRSNKIENILKRSIANGDPEPPYKEVEIFELQMLDHKTRMWKLIGFTNDMYTLNCPSRMTAKKTHEDDDGAMVQSLKMAKQLNIKYVRPPKCWEFAKKWHLDLDVREWVGGNYILDVVVVDDDEKWVYDYQPDAGSNDVFRRRRWLCSCRRQTAEDRETAEVQHST